MYVSSRIGGVFRSDDGGRVVSPGHRRARRRPTSSAIAVSPQSPDIGAGRRFDPGLLPDAPTAARPGRRSPDFEPRCRRSRSSRGTGRGVAGDRRGRIRISDDDGATWTDRVAGVGAPIYGARVVDRRRAGDGVRRRPQRAPAALRRRWLDLRAGGPRAARPTRSAGIATVARLRPRPHALGVAGRARRLPVDRRRRDLGPHVAGPHDGHAGPRRAGRRVPRHRGRAGSARHRAVRGRRSTACSTRTTAARRGTSRRPSSTSSSGLDVSPDYARRPHRRGRGLREGRVPLHRCRRALAPDRPRPLREARRREQVRHRSGGCTTSRSRPTTRHDHTMFSAGWTAFLKSTDRGATGRRSRSDPAGTPLLRQYVLGIAPDYANRHELYLGTRQGDVLPIGARRRTPAAGLGSARRARVPLVRASTRSDDGTIFAGTVNGVMRSDDRGATWTRDGPDGRVDSSRSRRIRAATARCWPARRTASSCRATAASPWQPVALPAPGKVEALAVSPDFPSGRHRAPQRRAARGCSGRPTTGARSRATGADLIGDGT